MIVEVSQEHIDRAVLYGSGCLEETCPISQALLDAGFDEVRADAGKISFWHEEEGEFFAQPTKKARAFMSRFDQFIIYGKGRLPKPTTLRLMEKRA